MNIKVRINNQIRVPEVRVITDDGDNLGVLATGEAIRRAQEMGLDLIEISPNATPPVAKIADYGRFQYAEKKKLKTAKTKVHIVEVKSIQVKVGTGEHDLELKAKKASEWLKEGHRVKINLFLTGRSKYMNIQFLNERLNRMLTLLTETYRIAETPQKSPKGLTAVIEKDIKKQ